MSTYAAEIDNCHNLSKVESLIVSPIFDKKGELKGVIQLLNKLGGERISEQDVVEIGSLLPALAEIFTTTEVVKKIYDISGGIEEYMVKMKQSVLSSAE